MENEPLQNLRKTPGRIASHCDRLSQYVDVSPITTPKKKRQARKRRSTGKAKLKLSDKKDKKEIQPTVDKFVNKIRKPVAKSLIEQFEDIIEEKYEVSAISVSDRIKKIESGYSTDLEIERRKNNTVTSFQSKLQTDKSISTSCYIRIPESIQNILIVK